MNEHKITSVERGCIGNCIFEHWGDPERTDDPEKRDRDYERCLENCRICA